MDVLLSGEEAVDKIAKERDAVSGQPD